MSCPLVDAYLPWAQATDFADARGLVGGSGSNWIWLLLELRIPAMEFARRALTASHRILVPGHYGSPPASLEKSRHCTALCSPEFLGALGNKGVPDPTTQALAEVVARFEIGFLGVPWQPDANPAPAGVADADVPRDAARPVLGIIDDGFACANARFLRRDGVRWRSRLLSLWDQSATPSDLPTQQRWAYGRLHETASIDAVLYRNTSPGGVVDEDQVYADMGYTEVRHRATHGTHVLDLAAGAEPDDPQEQLAAPTIVAVQLPTAVLEDTSCASLTVFVLDAMRHIVDQADRVPPGADLPRLIINLSMGNIAGPHNGSSIFEQAVDELVALRRASDGEKKKEKKKKTETEVVLPAGNTYLAQCHSWADVQPGGTLDLSWRLMPADGTPSFMELWLSPWNAPDDALAKLAGLKLLLTPPTDSGLSQLEVDAGDLKPLQDSAQRTVAMVNFPEQCANGTKALILIAVAPTEPRVPSSATAPCGVWQVQLHNGGETRLNCNAYIQRDDVAYGHRGFGRQSVFEDPDYQRFDAQGRPKVLDDDDAYLRRVGTWNGLATGSLVRVAGAATQENGVLSPAPYSSEPLPTAVAIASRTVYFEVDDSPVLAGTLASGTRTGSVVALQGTSMAAPQLSRELLLGQVQSSCAKRMVDHQGQVQQVVTRVSDATRLRRRDRRRGA